MAKNLTFAFDSYDVDKMVDGNDGNLCKGNIHSNFDVRKVIPFFYNYDTHALLLYAFVRLHYVDDGCDRI